MIVHDVEQGSEAWHALRAGKPTTSCFDKLITSTGEQSRTLPAYAITLAGEMYAGKPLDAWEGNGHTERGKMLEEEACLSYAFFHDVKPVQVGFVTDDSMLYGCSPDRFIGDDGGLEIKCLKAENHIKVILYFRKHKKCPPDYVQQTQGSILVCGKKWWDLHFYHPDLPDLTIRQEPNEVVINALKLGILTVLTERDRILGELRS